MEVKKMGIVDEVRGSEVQVLNADDRPSPG